MNKKYVVRIIKLFVKYLLPAFLGWLEGDSRVIEDSLSSLIGIIF